MMKDKIKKVLIVERGEMGLRALDVCVEMGIGFVIGFSKADNCSLLVKKALKHSQNMSGSGIAYIGGEPIEESYGNVSNIIATAKLWGCDAIYPGYGPLAEDHLAVKKIERSGLKFIGPASRVVEIFSNKMETRKLAQKNGLKLLKSFTVSSFEGLAKKCLDESFRYPFIIKSFFAGGGKGNYFIGSDEDLAKTLSNIDVEKKQYYVEEYVTGKHIELQFIVDSKKVINLGTRDCSCQINFQKFLEECPAEIKKEKLKTIEKKINKMLLDVGYRGVGTAEFIYDEKKNEYYFLEINPRIQVEVPVTEKFFDVDIVNAQFLIADNQEVRILKQNSSSCHVIEARIYARDIFNDFKQDSRKIEKLVLPKMKDIDIFPSYAEGDMIISSYDPLVLKIVSKSGSRKKAIVQLKKALRDLVILGPVTNKELILWLISTKEFEKNQVSQDFSEQAWKRHLKCNSNEIENFLKKGVFAEHKYKSKMNPDNFPNKFNYLKNGVIRDYIAELKVKHKSDSERCAFRFGIFKKDGVQCIFAWWDFSYFGGTLGVDEAIGISKCFQLANRKKIPVLMVSNSGGARQQENAFALHAMHYIVAIRKKYDVPLFANIYYGDNFGGVNASIVEQADIKIAIMGSRIGLAGPRFLSKVAAINNASQGIDSAAQHYRARNIDLVAINLEEACEQVLNIFSLLFCSKDCQLKKNNKDTKCDLLEVEKVGPLTLVEMLDSDLCIFENVALLANKKDDFSEPLAIIGAFVKIKGMRALVLGQNVPLTRKDGGGLEKEYIYPQASDFKWFRRKIKLAERLKIPIILFGDTKGADANTKSEYDGISYYISNALSDQVNLTSPIISVNIGLCGSGGGLPFANTADFAIAFEDSLKLVSNIDIQSSIITGTSDPTGCQQGEILSQLKDATAKFQKKYHFIDEVIAEKNKKVAVLLLKKLLTDGLTKLVKLDGAALVARRFDRIERVIRMISH